MRDHVVTMVDYISQPRPLGVHIPDEFAVEFILASLPRPFYTTVMRIRDTMEQRIRNILAESRAGPPNTGIFYTSINSNSWVYDTISVAHICNMMQGLRKMRKLAKDEVVMRVGNGVHVAARAIRVISLCLPSGFTLELNNCYFVPELCKNIISGSCLLRDGYSYKSENNGCSIYMNEMCYGFAPIVG